MQRKKASAKIFFDIFDLPRVRSGNTMGNSQMRKLRFHTRHFISIWNAYPSERMFRMPIDSKTDLR